MPECLGPRQGQIRVIAPDVGGGFGYKGILLPEEVCLGWLAMQLRPSGALDRGPARAAHRQRQLPRAPLRITGYADRDGRLLALDCEATVDSGAYSAYPFSACLEAAQVASILPGPYDFPHYRCRTWSVADQQGADPALSRRRAHRRVLRASS